MQKCPVCRHANIDQINRQIGRGQPLSEICRKYTTLSRSALQRHKRCALTDNQHEIEEIDKAIFAAEVPEKHVGVALDLRVSIHELHLFNLQLAQRAMKQLGKVSEDMIMPALNIASQVVTRSIKSIHDSVAVKILGEQFGREAEVLIRESITPEVLEQLPEGDYKE